MSEETTATVEFSDATKEFGDKIVGMTLKEAKELSDYLEDVHGIKPAAGGGAVIMAGPADGGDGAGGGEEVQSEFDVVLESFGDKKIADGAPGKVKEGLPKEEAEAAKAKLEEAGATVSVK